MLPPNEGLTMRGSKVLAVFMFALLTVGARPADGHRWLLQGTVEELQELDVRPFAIAHHGFGENQGEDPSRPIENAVPSVRKAFIHGRMSSANRSCRMVPRRTLDQGGPSAQPMVDTYPISQRTFASRVHGTCNGTVIAQ